MNRREFVKWLGWGTAAVAVAPSVISACEDPRCGSIAGEGIIPHDELHDYDFSKAEPVIPGSYADYTNFSSFARQESIDKMVMEAAEQLGKAAAEEINRRMVHLL